VYVSGEDLRRLLKAPPAKRRQIVVADDHHQGYHIDMDIMMVNRLEQAELFHTIRALSSKL